MDFLPILICGGLIVASVVACIVVSIFVGVPRVRRGLWPFPPIVLVPMLGLLGVTGFCAKLVHQGYVLNEPMASAACSGELDEVRHLLDRGASPNSCNVDCVLPAIVCAAREGHVDVVRLLLARGANPHATDHRGNSARLYAQENGHLDLVRILVEAQERSAAPAQQGDATTDGK